MKSTASAIAGGSNSLFPIYNEAYAFENNNLSVVSKPAKYPRRSAASQQSPDPVSFLGTVLKELTNRTSFPSDHAAPILVWRSILSPNSDDNVFTAFFTFSISFKSRDNRESRLHAFKSEVHSFSLILNTSIEWLNFFNVSLNSSFLVSISAGSKK